MMRNVRAVMDMRSGTGQRLATAIECEIIA
jgi:hypothetical protein